MIDSRRRRLAIVQVQLTRIYVAAQVAILPAVLLHGCAPVGYSCGHRAERELRIVILDHTLSRSTVTTSGACSEALCIYRGSTTSTCHEWHATMTGADGSECTATLNITSGLRIVPKSSTLRWSPECDEFWVAPIWFSESDIMLDGGQDTEPTIDFGQPDSGAGDADATDAGEE